MGLSQITKICGICIFLFCSSLYSATITFFNDSIFPLTAEVIAADGTHMGTMSVMPQHQMTWQDSNQNVTSFSESPYTVILRCKSGKEYGIWSDVSPGATITAQGSSGDRICDIQKQKSQEEQQQMPQQQNQPSQGNNS